MLLNRKRQVVMPVQVPLGFQSKRITKVSWNSQWLPETWQVAATECHLLVIPEWQSLKREKSSIPITFLLKLYSLRLKYLRGAPLGYETIRCNIT